MEDLLYRAWTEEELEWLREYNLNNARKEGLEKGESKMAQLIRCLINDGRMDDLNRAADDKAFREELYREYSIQ